tara:strand:- start:7732 stop:10104 length:2373 start_codon:yes stop_codon:yes gene_type:complete
MDDKFAYTGNSVLRKEDSRLLTGSGKYLDDIKIVGCHYVHFIRSNIAHGRIVDIDISEALNSEGITNVFIGKDLEDKITSMAPSKADGGIFEKELFEKLGSENAFIRREDRYPIAVEKVLHVGEIVAIVVGKDPYLVEDAAETIIVEIEELGAVSDPFAALDKSAPLLYDHWEDNRSLTLGVTKGDVNSAFANADFRVSDIFHSGRLSASPMETRGVIADFDDRTKRLTVWSSTQIPHPIKTYLAHSLNISASSIRVIAPDVGGGFGCKAIPYPEEILCALLSIELQIPVRWTEDRLEHFTSSIHSRDQFHNIELALDKDGKILAMRDEILIDSGASNPLGVVQPYNTIAHLAGCYEIPAMEINATAVVTNKAPLSPYRGAGRPEAVFAMDRILNIAASELGISQFDIRRRNLIPAEAMPYEVGINYRDGTPIVYDSGNFPACFEKAIEIMNSRCSEIIKSSEPIKHIGIGVATYVEGTGIGPFEGALVRVDETGCVTVAVGACPQGQGHETVFAQVAADALCLNLDNIMVITGDTDAVPFGWGTLASRSAVVAGSAVHEASTKLLNRMQKAVSDDWEIDQSDLVVQDGIFSVVGTPSKNISFQDVSERFAPGKRYAVEYGPGLEEQSYWQPPTVTFASGVHIAQVAVDPETGIVEILEYIVVHDCGPLINPQIVEGQIAGGVAQGIGAALYEEVCYDESAQPINPNFIDYIIPTNDTIPEIVIEHLETPSPLNPLGIKGVGEAGAIPPPAAIANAVEDALKAYEIGISRVPISPRYLLDQIDLAKKAGY